MFIAECSALATALCWSVGGLLATEPSRALGAVAFNCLRLSLAFGMLALTTLITGGWSTLTMPHSLALVASAVIGIFTGDTCFYAALKRLGPRRAGMLYTTTAPMTAILGYFVLGERLPMHMALGCLLIMVGVPFAIFFGVSPRQTHAFEKAQGSVAAAVALGLFSSLCQAVSVIIARPVLVSGVDPVAASALRVGVAALPLIGALLFRSGNIWPPLVVTKRILGLVALNSLIGMGFGMTFLLFALAHGSTGVVSTLSATYPIFTLPLLWIVTREQPAPGAWLGAFLAVIGTACIFNPWT